MKHTQKKEVQCKKEKEKKKKKNALWWREALQK